MSEETETLTREQLCSNEFQEILRADLSTGYSCPGCRKSTSWGLGTSSDSEGETLDVIKCENCGFVLVMHEILKY